MFFLKQNKKLSTLDQNQVREIGLEENINMNLRKIRNFISLLAGQFNNSAGSLPATSNGSSSNQFLEYGGCLDLAMNQFTQETSNQNQSEIQTDANKQKKQQSKVEEQETESLQKNFQSDAEENHEPKATKELKVDEENEEVEKQIKKKKKKKKKKKANQSLEKNQPQSKEKSEKGSNQGSANENDRLVRLREKRKQQKKNRKMRSMDKKSKQGGSSNENKKQKIQSEKSQGKSVEKIKQIENYEVESKNISQIQKHLEKSQTMIFSSQSPDDLKESTVIPAQEKQELFFKQSIPQIIIEESSPQKNQNQPSEGTPVMFQQKKEEFKEEQLEKSQIQNFYAQTPKQQDEIQKEEVEENDEKKEENDEKKEEKDEKKEENDERKEENSEDKIVLEYSKKDVSEEQEQKKQSQKIEEKRELEIPVLKNTQQIQSDSQKQESDKQEKKKEQKKSELQKIPYSESMSFQSSIWSAQKQNNASDMENEIKQSTVSKVSVISESGIEMEGSEKSIQLQLDSCAPFEHSLPSKAFNSEEKDRSLEKKQYPHNDHSLIKISVLEPQTPLEFHIESENDEVLDIIKCQEELLEEVKIVQENQKQQQPKVQTIVQKQMKIKNSSPLTLNLNSTSIVVNVDDEVPVSLARKQFFKEENKSTGLKYMFMEFLNWECEDIYDIDHELVKQFEYMFQDSITCSLRITDSIMAHESSQLLNEVSHIPEIPKISKPQSFHPNMDKANKISYTLLQDQIIFKGSFFDDRKSTLVKYISIDSLLHFNQPDFFDMPIQELQIPEQQPQSPSFVFPPTQKRPQETVNFFSSHINLLTEAQKNNSLENTQKVQKLEPVTEPQFGKTDEFDSQPVVNKNQIKIQEMPKLIPKSQKIVYPHHQANQRVVFHHGKKTGMVVEKQIPSMKTEVNPIKAEIPIIKTEPNQSYREMREVKSPKMQTQVFYPKHPIHPTNFVYTPKVTFVRENKSNFPFSTKNQQKKEVKFEEKEEMKQRKQKIKILLTANYRQNKTTKRQAKKDSKQPIPVNKKNQSMERQHKSKSKQRKKMLQICQTKQSPAKNLSQSKNYTRLQNSIMYIQNQEKEKRYKYIEKQFTKTPPSNSPWKEMGNSHSNSQGKRTPASKKGILLNKNYSQGRIGRSPVSSSGFDEFGERIRNTGVSRWNKEMSGQIRDEGKIQIEVRKHKYQSYYGK